MDGGWLVLNWLDGSVRIWDLDSVHDEGRRGPLELRAGQYPVDVDLSPGAKHLAYVVRAKRCSVWDLQDRREIHPAGLSQWEATGARFSPDNRFLAVSHAQGLELFRTADWMPAQSFIQGQPFEQPRFSARGCRLAAVRADSQIVVWDLGGSGLAELQSVFTNEFDVRRIVFSPDGRYLASSLANGMVQVRDVIRGAPFGPPLPGMIARFSADGTQLVLADERAAWLWELSRAGEGTVLVPPMVPGQAHQRSGDRSISVEIAGPVILLRDQTGQHSLSPVRVPIRRVSLTPDARHVMAESSDLRAWIWDVQTRTLVGPPRSIRFDAALETHSSLHLPVESRDHQFLSKMAALLGGQTPDGQGGLNPVDDTDRAQLFAELQRLHPQDFSPAPARSASWHRAHAESAERAMDWEGAVFHWEHFVNERLGVPHAKPEPGTSGSLNRDPAAEVDPEGRLVYALRAAEKVKAALLDGRSRWSVILPRPPWATPDMLDLTPFDLLPLGEPLAMGQAGPSFREMGSRVHVLGGTGFDVRGILPLDRVELITIRIGRPCRRIHFLQAASQPVSHMGVREGAGRYQLTYTSGDQVAVAVWNPEDVPPFSDDGFLALSSPRWAGFSPDLECALVWSGWNPSPGHQKELLFLTKTTWTLPEHPRERIVERLELHAGPARSVPLILGISVE